MSEQAGPSSRRALAAIVFTDIVNFSGRTAQNETKTLSLAMRDFDVITRVCQKRHGKVLKRTGDGLLMYFESAVEAVACALQVQHTLARQADKHEPEDVLMHRIGIHLGDVFLSEDDVLGDGVNVASRVQAEAQPGGICISQTVYDVVKNRLAIKATSLGPRDLKNIKDAVTVYQIVLQAQGNDDEVLASPPWFRNLWLLAGTGCAILAVVLVVVLAMRPPRTDSDEDAGPSGSGAVVSEANPDTSPKPTDASAAANLEMARRAYFTQYDFVGMVNWLETHDLSDTALHSRYHKIADFKQGLVARIKLTTEEKPLTIDDIIRGRRVSGRVWSLPDEVIAIGGTQGVKRLKLDQAPVPLMARIGLAYLKELPPDDAQGNRMREGYRLFVEEARQLKLLLERPGRGGSSDDRPERPLRSGRRSRPTD